MAVRAVPPDWFEDDHMVVTMLDVLREQAEGATKDRRRRGG